MPILVSKCPNCGANLIHQPDRGRFHCEYCRSNFFGSGTLAQPPEGEAAKETAAPPAKPELPVAEKPLAPLTVSSRKRDLPDDFVSQVSLYRCEACNRDLIASAPPEACPYCRRQLTTAGTVSSAWRPETFLPFSIDRPQAEMRFQKWARKYWLSNWKQLRDHSAKSIQGVYLPYWVVEGEGIAAIQATAEQRHYIGNQQCTLTTFDVEREGILEFNELILRASDRHAPDFIRWVYPYNLKSRKAFHPSELGHFVIERLAAEPSELESSVARALKQRCHLPFRNTIKGYSRVNERAFELTKLDIRCSCTLVPVWVLSYRHNGREMLIVMNGQSGKIAGHLPLSTKKMWAASLAGLFLLTGLFGGIG